MANVQARVRPKLYARVYKLHVFLAWWTTVTQSDVSRACRFHSAPRRCENRTSR